MRNISNKGLSLKLKLDLIESQLEFIYLSLILLYFQFNQKKLQMNNIDMHQYSIKIISIRN